MRWTQLGEPDSRTGLERIDGARWLDNAFNDGDSFHVLAGGRRFIVRLYHVDSAETDHRYPDRIEEQRLAFGLGSAQETLAWGRKAKEFTASLVRDRPLTLYTSWRNAGGESKEPRYYAYVVLPDGSLLSERLVHHGLARPHGMPRNLPDGTSSGLWRKHLDGQFRAVMAARRVPRAR